MLKAIDKNLDTEQFRYRLIRNNEIERYGDYYED